MRPNILNLNMATVSLTGFATAVTGASWTISTNATPDGLAHQVSVTNNSVTDHSAKTIVLVGTDSNNAVQTETFAAPGTSATVTSVLYYKTLTSATPSATIGTDTFGIGWTAVSVGAVYPLDWPRISGCTISVGVTGTINFTVQETFVNIWENTPVWQSITALASKTAATTAISDVGATAIRVLVNSYSTSAALQVYTVQPGKI